MIALTLAFFSLGALCSLGAFFLDADLDPAFLPMVAMRYGSV
jgi:hypothetical protein